VIFADGLHASRGEEKRARMRMLFQGLFSPEAAKSWTRTIPEPVKFFHLLPLQLLS
jgi:hypothetical protein